MDSNQILAESLKRLMAKSKTMRTQPQVHEKTGIGAGTVSRLVNGVANPKLGTVDLLAKAFRVPTWKMLMPEQETDPAYVMGAQLAALFDELSDEGKDKVLTLANYIHNLENPGPSPANPFSGVPIGKEKAAQSKAKGKST